MGAGSAKDRTLQASNLNNDLNVKHHVLKPRSHGQSTGLEWANAAERVTARVGWFERLDVAKMALMRAFPFPLRRTVGNTSIPPRWRRLNVSEPSSAIGMAVISILELLI